VVIILLGPPGAGKGTQAQLIASQLGLPRVVTGEIFRAAVANGDALGRKVKPYLDSGKLVPDALTCGLVVDRLMQADCRHGALLDGFPRTLAQARWLDRDLKAHQRAVDQVIHLSVSDAEVVRRLTGRLTCSLCQAPYHRQTMPPRTFGICDRCGGELIQRSDDTDDAVHTRLRVYREQTAPVLDYYRDARIMLDVDGEQPSDAVFDQILARLRPASPVGRSRMN